MVDPGLVGIIAALASPLLAGGFGVFGIWLGKRSDWKQAAEEADGTNALSWQDRLTAIETRADEREKAAEAKLEAMRLQLKEVQDELRTYNERWRVVTSALSQLLWEIAQQWPPGSPHPVLNGYLLTVLEQYGVADLIPAAFRGTPVDKD